MKAQIFTASSLLSALLLFMAVACTDSLSVDRVLDRADSLSNVQPDSALHLLDSLNDSRTLTTDHRPQTIDSCQQPTANSQRPARPEGALAQPVGARTAAVSRSQKMRLELLRARCMNKAYIPVGVDGQTPSDSMLLDVVHHYDRHGTPNEQMEAHYLLGCAYRDMGEAPQALQCFNDAYGNVSGIIRYGKSSPNTYGLMDNLTLTYDGYRLAGVSETVADNNISGSLEYKRANGSQYIYDGNGNLVADKSRGMAYITYDSNSNPQQVYFTNGNVTKYLYSAAGQKLRVVHYTAKPNITRTFGVRPAELTSAQILYKDSTDYLLGGSLVMANGTVDKYFFDGGFADTSPTNNNQFLLYYYNKDHLGNNREVVAVIGSVKQVTNYYPFGAPYTGDPAEHNTDFQPYKYNGKELDKMHGLDTYDYGARQYDPVLARWDRMDPLCEKYYNVSPYVYCAGNPVNLVDLDGRMFGDYLDSNGNLIGTDGKDERLYVLKTSKSSFDSYGNAPVAGITKKEAKRVVREKDITNKNYFVEITGSKAIREAAVSMIGDDGTGGTSDKNNCEYLVTFDKSIEPHETNAIYCKKGPVGDPTKDNTISVSAGDSPDINYIHTHPSGTKNGSSWYQAPSNQDVMNTTTQKYVIGMGDKTVYIYNSNGINATLPLDIYKNYESTTLK